jgi:nitrate/nitrite transport system substrate-binding protein
MRVPLLLFLLAAACSGGAAADPPVTADEPALSDEALADRAMALARLEKTHVKLGFIKLTDCAPLVIAAEKGYFEDEGLVVTLEAQSNWKILLDRVLSGELDGAHMLAGQPLGASVGVGTRADLITAFSMDLNGNGITLSTEIAGRMNLRPGQVPSATTLAPLVEERKARGTPLQLGMVFPVSTHNYELRYWLAAAGIHPGFYTPQDSRGVVDADVLISVTPPPQMPATLEAGTIQGYCVGEPWNEQAAVKGIGVMVATDHDVWRYNPEKVFGVTRDWADRHPNVHVALVKALIRANRWLDDQPDNRAEAARILAQRQYVGADAAIIAAGLTRPDAVVFFRHDATYPFYSDAIWYLTQMRRWGQIAEPQPDAWYHETAKRVYRPDIYRTAAQALVAEGKLSAAEIPQTDGYRPPTSEFIDGIEYDGRAPNDYLARLKIGHKP